MAIAFATASAVAVLLWAAPFSQRTPGPAPVVTQPGTGAAIASEVSPYTGAHALLSASDTTGDPNRNIILLYGAPSGDG